MKRRALCLMLSLIALCLPLMGTAEQPQPDQLFGGLLYEKQDNVSSLLLYDGQALMLTGKALYGWRPGEEKAREITRVAPVHQNMQLEEDRRPAANALIENEGRLYGTDLQQGILWELEVGDGEVQFKEALRLDWSEFIVTEGDYSYTDAPQYVLAAGGRLFVKATNWGSEKAQDLFSYDLKTGNMRRYTPLHYQTLVPYKDGKLLAVYFDQNEQDPDTFRQLPAQLRLFDPEMDRDEPLQLKLPQDERDQNRRLSLYYHEKEDRVYAANGEGLWRLSESEEPVKVARLPMTGSWFYGGTTPSIQPLAEDRLLINYGANVFIRGMDEKQMPAATTLTLNDNMYGQALAQALMSLDGIDVTNFQGEWMDEKDIHTRFLLGDMPLDIIGLSSNYNDAQRLMQKGYLLDLSDDPALSRMGQDSYDTLKPVMYDNGRLYLLPVSVDTTFLSAYGENFKEIGRQIPQSYPELLAFVRWWAEEGYKAHEGYALFDQPDVKQVLKRLAYDLYKDSCFGQGKPLHFDMEVFGKLMQEIDAIDVSGFDVKPEDLDEEDYGMVAGKPLFMSYMGYSIQDVGPDGTTDVKLSLDGKMPPYYMAYVQLLGIPATTKHPEEAKRLLASYLSHMAPETRATFSKSWTEPIENPNYEETVAQAQNTLDDYRRLYEKAEEGAKKRQYAEDIQHMEELLKKGDELWRYTVSEKGLERHRVLMSQMYVNDSLSLVANEALSKDGSLFYMYLQGTLTLEQFMSQANDKIRLMTLEAK